MDTPAMLLYFPDRQHAVDARRAPSDHDTFYGEDAESTGYRKGAGGHGMGQRDIE
jgi:hypothetical protein